MMSSTPSPSSALPNASFPISHHSEGTLPSASVASPPHSPSAPSPVSSMQPITAADSKMMGSAPSLVTSRQLIAAIDPEMMGSAPSPVSSKQLIASADPEMMGSGKVVTTGCPPSLVTTNASFLISHHFAGTPPSGSASYSSSASVASPPHSPAAPSPVTSRQLIAAADPEMMGSAPSPVTSRELIATADPKMMGLGQVVTTGCLPSPVTTNASTPISLNFAGTPPSGSVSSHSFASVVSPPHSPAAPSLETSRQLIATADPEMMESEQAVTTENKTKHLDIGTSVVLASNFAWICGLLFSSNEPKMMAYRKVLIVITVMIIFSICIGLIAFLISATFPVASRVMKIITISTGIVGAILSTSMVFLVLL